MAKVGRRAGAGSGIPRGWIIAGLVALLVAGGVAALVAFGGPPQTVNQLENRCTPTGKHEHVSFRVYVNNATVLYNYPQFDYAGGRGVGRLAGHLHLPYDHTMHLEGGNTGCTTLALFFRAALQGSLTPDRMRLDEVVHKSAVYEDGKGGELRFFLGKPPFEWTNQTYKPAYPPVSTVNWTEVPDLPYHQLYDGEYALITFGNEDAGAIRWQQLSIPTQNAAE